MSPIDDYLAKLPGDQRAALEDLRRRIHAAVPGLTEVISYGLPGFRLDGVLVWMGGAKAHCAFYPHGLADEYADRLTGFETSKGAIRFQPEKPLPPELVREIVQRRADEDREKTAVRNAKRKKA